VTLLPFAAAEWHTHTQSREAQLRNTYMQLHAV